jgi:hypothetical protein
MAHYPSLAGIANTTGQATSPSMNCPTSSTRRAATSSPPTTRPTRATIPTIINSYWSYGERAARIEDMIVNAPWQDRRGLLPDRCTATRNRLNAEALVPVPALGQSGPRAGLRPRSLSWLVGLPGNRRLVRGRPVRGLLVGPADGHLRGRPARSLPGPKAAHAGTS